MRPPFARKPKPQAGPSYRNKTFEFRRTSEQTVRRRKSTKLAGTVASLREKRSIIFSALGAAAVIVLLALVSSLLTSDTFRIKQIAFIGNSTLSDSELSARFEPFMQQNIFLTRTDTIETALINSDLYFEEVSVQKFLPDRLQVMLRERQPNTTLINFNGVYLVDDDGTVIEIIAEGKVNLSQSDIDIIKGLGNPNADYVKQRMRLDLNQPRESEDDPVDQDSPEGDTQDSFDFTGIPLSRKIATLEQIRSELLAKASEIHSNFARQASQSLYAGLPRVYVYSNDPYVQNDKVDLARLELTHEARVFFAGLNDYIIERVTWESPYIVSLAFTNGKTVTMGTQRDYREQLEDFAVISEQLRIRGEEYAEMDLSSSKVSVK
ncbi:MAG: Cell division protein FtsQ [candidate division WS6 bacterium OLB20]|uniref:Cell division protein FtsQ n=1 Tax=candidate division WS6 bacterium OLB20 TaxID=1617426 RepID=A0A136LZK4_9BACT|nr:MAG: Cell division protein FtsQ [candidate division WS6 bacterium OLB20]